MNDDRLFFIASRINLLLLRQLGLGIDVKRLLSEPLYGRDVLLVCEADPGSALDSLSRQFRQLGVMAAGTAQSESLSSSPPSAT
jgi:hypothetical protein